MRYWGSTFGKYDTPVFYHDAGVQSRKGMTMDGNNAPRLELITPEFAVEALKHNTNNRNITMPRVEAYVRDMTNGNWTVSYDPIAFDENGRLLNGQHRLTAVVRSNVAVWMYVVRNAERETVFDRGFMRTTANSLLMRGTIPKELSKAKLVSIARNYIIETRKSMTPTDDEIGDILVRYGDTIQAALKISANGTSHPLGKKAGCQVALMAALLAGVSKSKLEEMFHIVNTGMSSDGGVLPEQSSAVVLRDQIRTASPTVLGGRRFISSIAELTETAIRDFDKGVPRKRPYTRTTHVYLKVTGGEIKK